MTKQIFGSLIFFIILLTFKPLQAQTKLNCAELKEKLTKTISNAKTTRVGYDSKTQDIGVDFEQDAASNTHFMYHAYKKDRKSFAQIKLGDKTFSTNKNDEWEEKPSKVDYQAWIDSTKEGLRMLDKPFKDCALEREVKLTGTPYAVYAVYIENDTISVFLNQKTDKIERFKGRNYAKGISYTAYFDLPFEIKAPKIPSEKTNKYTYFNLFPPMYSDNEDYDGNEPVFVFGDKTAEFEDGQAKMFQFLGMNVRYPEKARKNGVEGTVYIGFVVEKDGAITNINLKRGIAKDCNAEAIRVIELMSGKWNAGEFQGKKVRMAYTLPIKFKLE